MHPRSAFEILVCSPPGMPDPTLPIAGSRAGAIGILNLELVADLGLAVDAIDRLVTFGRGRFGVLLDGDAADLRAAILDRAPAAVELVCIMPSSAGAVAAGVRDVHAAGRRAFVVATSEEVGRAAEAAGADAVIAKGHEAGGWVGEESAFVLLQRLIARLNVPVWAWGGVGLHTAAACAVAGAAGVVLDNQLLLTRESPLPEPTRARIRSMDGSETVSLGGDLGAQLRVYSRPGLAPVDQLRDIATSIALAGHEPAQALGLWRAAVREAVGWADQDRHALAIGQDAAFAGHLADRFVTVGGVVEAIRASVVDNMRVAQELNPLAEGSPLAMSHGVQYPIVQGPMTRVSDRAVFAAAVASAGALAFLALALMRANEVDALLDETERLLGDRRWGVGVLGFVPSALRAEQLEVIRRYRPPFALIAGGRPDQARSLEADGIATYLHVPSPGLLALYLKDGARRFVFEGRECGGHVGPRTSFVLWDTMVRTLLADLPRVVDPTELHVLFAGGIHDATSAAMVAAIAAPLAAHGVRVGVLLGTAYLFTDEAVASAAITSGFQAAAVSCGETVLLESGPGHATRCLPSPFVDDFNGEKLELMRTTTSSEEIRNRLEELNIGRLRIASKGVDRNPDYGRDPAAPKLIAMDSDAQWARGMYMIGQVAALREQVIPMAALHASVSAGSAEVLERVAMPEKHDKPSQPPARIAVVGIGSILPGAPDAETFWANVVDKVDAVTEIPASRWDWRQYYDPDRSKPDKIYSKWGGFIDDVLFDPVEFGMPPRSLQSIEPFQLLGLLVVKAALEDAGYATRPFDRERTSVVLGAGGGGADLTAGYMVRSRLPLLFGDSATDVNQNADGLLPEWTEDSFPGLLMNVASGRIANRFDFGGANFTVDAACASSLAAVYLAIRDLQTGNSDMAIVGGVDAIQNPFAYLCFSKTQALSPTGRCRPFDAGADGIAISEGFAAMVLKRLDDAERDGDRIYAVIQGVGAASDGRDRSMTAPRPEGQMRALDRAYAHAGYSPATVGLFEAHGTGTVAGDQAEVEALATVLERSGAATQGSALGSVKSMIGHTKATAGVAGLMKAALALHHRVLPPTLGVTRPNPKADFPHSPLYVNSETRPWIRSGSHPRRAGVSAFGFGGTDFHLALEEYQGDFLGGPAAMVGRMPAELLIWRGNSRGDLTTAVDRLLAQLDAGATPSLADLAYSLYLDLPKAGGPTLAIVAESLGDLAAKLRVAREVIQSPADRQHLPSGVHFAEQGYALDRQVAFVFPGQGSQYANMGREVAVAFPDVREMFDWADDLLSGMLDQPLSRYIFPPPGFTPEEEKQQRAAITETNVAQPALGVTDLAFCSLLRTFGVTPAMVAGHSYGEFVALAAAGSITEEDMLRLSEARGRFMREGATGESGTMAAVDAPRDALAPLLADPDITLANLNSPKQTVISGGEASIARAIEWCDAHGLRARRLPVACAFHSPYVAPAQGRLAELLQRTPIASPQIPVYSNSTAEPYPDDPTAIARLLAEHLTSPVEWVAEIEAMYEAGAQVFVEVGPRTVLTGLVGSILEGRPHLAISVDQPGRNGVVQLQHCLAALAAEGVPVELNRLFHGRRLKALDVSALPTDAAPAHSSSTWLVNGGGARPANAAPRGAGRQAPLTVSVSTTTSSDVQASTKSTASATPAGPPAIGSPATTALPPIQPPTSNGHHVSNGSHQVTAAPRKGVVPMTSTVPNGASTSHVPEAGDVTVAPSGQANLPAVYGSAPAPLAGGSDRVSDVMARHQQVMQQFLETQRSVMLAYLGAYRPAPEQRWIEASVVPRERVVEIPPHTAPLPSNGHSRVETPPPAVSQAPPAPPRQPIPVVEAAPPPPQPVAPAPAPVVESVPVASQQPLGREQLIELLLSVVSDRTGYPPEMLGLDADLEADLGIDSIKRVEIAGTMMQSLPVPEGTTPDIERITASRTLNQVVDALAALMAPAPSAPALAAAKEDRRPFDHEPAGERIGRFMVQPYSIGPVNRAGQLAPDGAVVLIDDGSDVGAQVASLLSAEGRASVRIDGRSISIDDADGVQVLVDGLRAQHGRIAALVHLATLGRDDPVALDDPARAQAELDHNLTPLFLVSQALQADLEAAAAAGGAVILAAIAQGGTFAVDGAPENAFAGDGALAGYIKTVPQEWSGVRAKAVDIGRCDPDVAARRILDDLFSDERLVEIGYRDGERFGVRVVPAPVAGREA
ncbi:MAG TPA: beta-ketoacyl synthase N-terminal-like domain-containing protein, partial [Thermomicrobiales bacterium]|nr:beta-ketoacyl synthase N-terminal-like domain-containing protein [Thermomicrobiales bacterium]